MNNDTPQNTKDHWEREDLSEAIRLALIESGKDLNALTLDDLAPFDQFHGGGKRFTLRLANLAGLKRDMHILDVGAEVKFGPRNLGYSKEKIDELVKRALALTELSDKTEINPYDLSPTWRKMVALASVIAMDTPIVIFDEPTTGQDAVNVARIAHVIAELRREGKTVITITHDIDFCAENFERVIALANGQVLLDDAAADVFAQEEILAQTYVDPPQLTRLGKKLGLKETVRSQDEFLNSLKKSIDASPSK